MYSACPGNTTRSYARASSLPVRKRSRSSSERYSTCLPILFSQETNVRSQSRNRNGTPKSRYARRRSTERIELETYHESPQPSPFSSRKLYACHVFVESTTAIRDCEPNRRGRTTSGAYDTRPSLDSTRRKYSPLGQSPARANRTMCGALGWFHARWRGAVIATPLVFGSSSPAR